MTMSFSLVALGFAIWYLFLDDPVGKPIVKAFAIGCAIIASLLIIARGIRNGRGE